MRNLWIDIKFWLQMSFWIILLMAISIIAISPFIAIGYVLMHPELIGAFFGKIINGFNAAK